MQGWVKESLGEQGGMAPFGPTKSAARDMTGQSASPGPEALLNRLKVGLAAKAGFPPILEALQI